MSTHQKESLKSEVTLPNFSPLFLFFSVNNQNPRMFIQEDVSSTFHKERERPTKLITTNLLFFLEKMRNEGDKEGNAGERK